MEQRRTFEDALESGLIITQIVGSRHYTGAAYRLQQLSDLTPLTLLRDPTNQYDENAIEVHDSSDDLMLGHIPRMDAAHLAPLLDAGEVWVASIKGMSPIVQIQRREAKPEEIEFVSDEVA